MLPGEVDIYSKVKEERDVLVSLVRSKDLVARLGDEDGVLKLCREGAVAGDGCPAIPPEARCGIAHVQDRLDRKRLTHLHPASHAC